MSQKVWTFVIRGGEPIGLSLPRNPTLDHDGEMTMWKLVATETTARMVETLLLDEAGAQVEVYTEEETEEQKTLREARLKSR